MGEIARLLRRSTFLAMPLAARYAHTNLTARDWRRLAQFYIEVFGCLPQGAERDLSGAWLDVLTGLAGARIEGVHLLLPGHGEGGPTLEIFTYAAMRERGTPTPHEPGFGHLAFQVGDVEAALAAVLAAGGGKVGGAIETEIPGAGRLRVVYARDPEGNILELQRWS